MLSSMRTCTRLALVAWLVAAQGTRQKPAEPPPPPRLDPFIGKLEAARALAHERNVPILLHIVLEGEAENESYRASILSSRELTAACANVIVIIANNGTHPTRVIEETVGGEKRKRELCANYPVPSCADHKASWQEMFTEFKDPSDGKLYCPQAIVLTADGKLSGRINRHTAPTPSEIQAMLLEAQLKSGPGVTAEQLVEIKRLVAEGQTLSNTKSWPEAWRTWQKLVTLTPKSPYGLRAQSELALAQTGIDTEFARIAALLVPGQAALGFKQLVQFKQQCAGLANEKQVVALIKRAEGDRAIKDEIAAYKLTVEADQLLREARQFFDAGDQRKGELCVRRLFGKRFATTTAAASARELWPKLFEEEAARTAGGAR